MSTMAMGADEIFDDEEQPQRPRRALLLALGVAAFAAVIGVGWTALQLANRQPVARIQVEGSFARLKVNDVEAALRPLVDRAFGDLDLQAARAAVEALPWVARASVERVWPATVRVRTWERQPFARWGADALLDIDARVFTPAPGEIPDGLPQLAGAAGNETVVIDMYRLLSARLASSSFPLQGITQDARGEWLAHTTSGLELRFGRGDPMEKLESLLGSAERVLKNRISEVKYLDLRYTNGFSVGWNSAPSVPRDGAQAVVKEAR